MDVQSWFYYFYLTWNHLGLLDLIDILFVWALVYRVLMFIRGTGAVQILAGLGIVASSFILSIWFELDTLNWILEQFFNNLFLIVVILFQSEIRRALAHIGRNPFFTAVSANQETKVIEEILSSSYRMAKVARGALIVFEREMGLENLIEKGQVIDADTSSELIESIFHPQSPLHDGAMIIQGGRIGRAGCFLPLTQNPDVKQSYGTRHRAAIGLTEESDAVVIVVSEETRQVSLVMSGKIDNHIHEDELRKKLYSVFEIQKGELLHAK